MALGYRLFPCRRQSLRLARQGTSSELSAAARRGEKSLLFSFEESLQQVTRNMRSVGMDLEPLVKSGVLRCEAFRATSTGLEMHLLKMQREIEEFRPRVVVLDPISALVGSGAALDVKTMLLRLLDFLKQHEVTTLLTFLTGSGDLQEAGLNMSSFVDVWILLKDIESNGELNRGLHILKSRGMAHSNQVREMLITSKGILLRDVYLGPSGVVTGSARVAQEAAERDQATRRQEESDRWQSTLDRKRADLEDKISGLHCAFEAEQPEIMTMIGQAQLMKTQREHDRQDMARSRRVVPNTASVRKGAAK